MAIAIGILRVEAVHQGVLQFLDLNLAVAIGVHRLCLTGRKGILPSINDTIAIGIRAEGNLGRPVAELFCRQAAIPVRVAINLSGGGQDRDRCQKRKSYELPNHDHPILARVEPERKHLHKRKSVMHPEHSLATELPQSRAIVQVGVGGKVLSHWLYHSWPFLGSRAGETCAIRKSLDSPQVLEERKRKNSVIRTTITLALIVLAGLTPATAAVEVRCESQLAGYNYCRGDTASGVRLVQQLDRHSCIQNDTWGYDANGVWVANGCRAVFALGSSNPSGQSQGIGGMVLGLFGLGNQRVAEPAPSPPDLIAPVPPAAEMERSRRQSSIPSYGSAAVAVIPPPAPVVRCESTGVTQRCPAYFRSHVELYRKLSPAECRFNVTWGYAYGLVWVDKGCRAEFALY